LSDDATARIEPGNLLGDGSCAQCGATTSTTPSHLNPSTGFIEFEYHLCAFCAADEASGIATSNYLTAPGRLGLTGLPDPEGLPSLMQITDLNQPSDTQLPD